MKSDREKVIKIAKKNSRRSSSRKKEIKKQLSKIKRRILKHVILVRLLIIALVLLVLGLGVWGIENKVKELGWDRYPSMASDFFFTPDEKIKESDGVTAVLILGRGGEGHEAPDLTDTMIVMFIDHDSGKVSLLSLPRDIWIADMRTKLNSVYYWGEKKATGTGVSLVSAVVEDIVGTPIHYSVLVDFGGFTKVIDAIDGVDVGIQEGFVDEKYPIKGKENDECDGDLTYSCRYETIEFKEGIAHMGGELALKFVRSRNAEGDQGTDIARGERQQLVIKAIQEKVLTKDVLTSPSRVVSLLEILDESVETDMDDSEKSILVRRLYDARDDLKRISIPEEYLNVPEYSDEYDNLYVFIPASGDWGDLQEYISEAISN